MNHPHNKIKPIYWQHALLVAFFALLCAVLQFFNAQGWTALNTQAPITEAKWTLITAHLIHLDWHHYIMNMIGLALCVAVFVKEVSVKHWFISFVVISIFSSIGQLYWSINYSRYMGFSDVLHGWILLGAAILFKTDRKLTIIIYTLFIGKLIQENLGMVFFGKTSMIDNVAKESHILGAIGGFLYAIVVFYIWPVIAKNSST